MNERETGAATFRSLAHAKTASSIKPDLSIRGVDPHMNRNLRPHRRKPACRPLRLEWLEGRVVLSTSGFVDSNTTASFTSTFDNTNDFSDSDFLAPNLTVVGISPSSDSTVYAAPSTLGVTFDRPIDPFSLAFDSIRVDKQNTDGSWSTITEAGLPAFDESVDESGTALQLTPHSALTPGLYRIVLPADSWISGTDGSFLASDGNDQVLGQFEYTQKGVTLDQATVLGPLKVASSSSDPASAGLTTDVQGTLDLAANARAVNLYQFTVPEGHFWRFGAEVQSQRLGGTLLSAVALFDSQGRAIKVSTTGRLSTPADAYLFAGIGPGTYYIGVSGSQNLPGAQFGGYDPITGDPGDSERPQSGGSYVLKMSVDAEDSPLTLTKSSIDSADPLDSTPTGLTLFFNGVLDSESVRGTPTRGFVLLNDQGQSFPLTIVKVNESAGQYKFLFEQKLLAGHYTLKTTGAVDLIGLTPIAKGEPTGTLLSFNVAPTPNQAINKYNLGVTYDDILTGVGSSDTIQPGTAVTYRIALAMEGFYQVGESFSSGKITTQILGSNGIASRYTAVGSPGASLMKGMNLVDGVYLITFKNVSNQTVQLKWSINLANPWDSFFVNGVGQSSAMSLRLTDPGLAGQGASSSTATGPFSTPTFSGPISPVTSSDSHSASSTVTPPPTSPLPSSFDHAIEVVGNGNSPLNRSPGLPITLGNVLVGRPTTGNDHVGAVSFGVEGASAPLALLGRGLPQGVGLGQGLGVSGPTAISGSSLDNTSTRLDPVNGAIVFRSGKAPAKADELVVAAGDWLSKLSEFATEVLASRSSRVVDEGPIHEVLPRPEKIVLTRDDSPVRADHVEAASLGAPLSIGLFSMVTVKYFNHDRGSRQKRRTNVQSRRHPSVIRGPHGKF